MSTFECVILLYVYLFIVDNRQITELLNFSNLDLDSIVTPVKPNELGKLLYDCNYDRNKTDYLVKGFTEEFDLDYQGGLKGVKRFAPNLKLRIGSLEEFGTK